AVRLRDVQEVEVPLVRPDNVGASRHGRNQQRDNHAQHRANHDQPLPVAAHHRSIPMTPGPGSCRVGSGGGSRTGGTPLRTSHSVSAGKESFRSRRTPGAPAPTCPPKSPPTGLTDRVTSPSGAVPATRILWRPGPTTASESAGAEPITPPVRSVRPAGVETNHAPPAGPDPPVPGTAGA